MLAATRAAEALTEIRRQMRITRRGLDLAVTEQLRDIGQAFSQRQRSRKKGVASIMKSNFLEPRPFPHDPPRTVQVGHVRAGFLPRYYPDKAR